MLGEGKERQRRKRRRSRKGRKWKRLACWYWPCVVVYGDGDREAGTRLVVYCSGLWCSDGHGGAGGDVMTAGRYFGGDVDVSASECMSVRE